MGQTNIRYTDESINTAFSAFYVIPEYQREYVWEKTQVKQLMEDLLDAYTSDKNKAYFLGTIVTCSANGDFELVDGQQRLTTFFIILCIVKKLYAEYGIPTASIDQLICGTSLNQYGVPVTRYRLELQHQNVTNCLELIAKGEPRPSDVSKTGSRRCVSAAGRWSRPRWAGATIRCSRWKCWPAPIRKPSCTWPWAVICC